LLFLASQRSLNFGVSWSLWCHPIVEDLFMFTLPRQFDVNINFHQLAFLLLSFLIPSLHLSIMAQLEKPCLAAL
jgi:hypothetical protein